MEPADKPDGASGPDRAASNDDANKRQQGKSRGNPYRGRRNPRNNNKERQENKSQPSGSKERFTGRSDDLDGYVYSVATTKAGLQFTRTTDEIARYAGEKYSAVGSYIRTAILTMTAQVPTRPTAPGETGTPPTVDPVDQAIFNEEIRQFVKEKAGIVAAMKGLYSVIWGQCSETLRSRLKSNADHAAISATADSLGLLKAIRAEMTGFKKLHYLPHSVHTIMREFYQLAQGRHRTNHEYYDEFNNLVAAVDDCGAMIAMHPTIYQEILNETVADASNPTPDKQTTAGKIGRERYLAVAFLLGADRVRYGMMIEEIENEYLRNRDESSKVGSYPLTIANPYEYLENYKKNQRICNACWAKLTLGCLEWHSPKQTKRKTVVH